MATYTSNLNLKKPGATDVVNINDINGNMDILDQAIYGKESSISKNTAFNKDFGSTAGTVCEGNDARLSDSRNASDVSAWAKAESKPTYSASEIKGYLGYTPAELDENNKVLSSQLPSYVDDVLEGSLATFPATGESGKIYVDTNTNLSYRWSGSTYIEISPSIGLGETSQSAYRGDRGKEAYEHSQLTHDKAMVGLGNVDNTSDINKPVSTEQQTAINKAIIDITTENQITDAVDGDMIVTDWVKNLWNVNDLRQYYGGNISYCPSYYTVSDAKITAASQPLNSPLPGNIIYTGGETSISISGYTNVGTIHIYYSACNETNTIIQPQSGYAVSVSNGYFSYTIENIPSNAYYINLGVGSAKTANYYVDKICVVAGNIIHPYVPYLGYDAISCGKNFLNQNTNVIGSIGGTGTDIASSTRIRTSMINLTENEHYRISALGDFNRIEIETYKNEIFIGTYQSLGWITTNSFSFFTNGFNQVRFLFCKSDNGNYSSISEVYNVQLEKGSTATSYEPFREPSTITLTNDTLSPVTGLKSYDGVTNILTDYGVPIEVAYPTNKKGNAILQSIRNSQIITSPNGTAYKLQVSDAGVLSATTI